MTEQPENEKVYETTLPDGTHVTEKPVTKAAERFGVIATIFVCAGAGLVFATVVIALCVRLWDWIV
jgi:hypothetical protein